MSSRLVVSVVAALVLSTGCATKQVIKVNSEPAGATVTIVKIIEKTKKQDAAGITTKEEVESYDGKPESIGTTPIEKYKFEPYWEGWVRAGLYRWKLIKHCKRARIIAEKDGLTAETLVEFNADHEPVTVDLKLEQKK